MNKAFVYIGSAWEFYKSQPLLNQVLGWFFIAPLTCSFVLDFIQTNYASLIEGALHISHRQLYSIGLGLEILITLWVLIGYACTFAIAKRIVKSAAGRNRSSLHSVFEDAKPIVLPLLLTNILRECITLLWMLPYTLCVVLYLFSVSPEKINTFAEAIVALLSLQETELPADIAGMLLLLTPLILPAIYYRIRTLLYDIIIGIEGTYYRDALAASKKAIRGKFWLFLGQFLTILVCTYLPAAIVSGIMEQIITSINPSLGIISSLIFGTMMAIATMFSIIANIFLYKDLTSS